MGATTITDDIVAGIADGLAEYGLNRCRAISLADLGPEIWLTGHHPAEHGAADVTGRTLLLIGHGGTMLWERIQMDDTFDFAATSDPIDTWSVTHSVAVLARVLPTVERTLLYPLVDCPIDLVALGRAMGWHTRSPLGLGISERYGLWSAFRALWLLDVTADVTSAPSPTDMCARCETQDCVSACPANAVNHGRDFKVKTCLQHRSKLNSECAETCLSRRACPVGIEHRYTADQMTYHYRLSRPSVVDGP